MMWQSATGLSSLTPAILGREAAVVEAHTTERCDSTRDGCSSCVAVQKYDQPVPSAAT